MAWVTEDTVPFFPDIRHRLSKLARPVEVVRNWWKPALAETTAKLQSIEKANPAETAADSRWIEDIFAGTRQEYPQLPERGAWQIAGYRIAFDDRFTANDPYVSRLAADPRMTLSNLIIMQRIVEPVFLQFEQLHGDAQKSGQNADAEKRAMLEVIYRNLKLNLLELEKAIGSKILKSKVEPHILWQFPQGHCAGVSKRPEMHPGHSGHSQTTDAALG